MKNTVIEYRYQDGSNNKAFKEEIFAGPVDEASSARITAALVPSDDPDEIGNFVPGQVGLQDLQNAFYERHMLLAKAMGSDNLPQDADPAARAAAERFDALRDSMSEVKPIWWPDDHPLHTIVRVEGTDKTPTVEKTIAEFIEELEATEWDGSYTPPFYDEMIANYDDFIALESPDEALDT
ncbi:hypothetical protein ACGYLO_10490 [Sulfitobacter sp. 1A13353]|uniref:hypothetical protein n=1 Tax=Sulfitobacter sp. 1A13353 TaxID=3368568 RepID=UPI00374503F9